MESLGSNLSGPEVSTYDIEALLNAVSPTEPIFLDSEPTRTGRKRKAKDMSGLTVCFCGERAKPDDEGSIRCRKAGCATLWVCLPATFRIFIANTSYSIILNVLGIRTRGRGPGCVTHAHASQARATRARRLGAVREASWYLVVVGPLTTLHHKPVVFS